MKKVPKLIIFDFDGVIVSGTNQGYFYCYHKALESVGVKLPPKIEKARIDERWGKGHKSQLQLLLKEYPRFLQRSIVVWEKCYESDDFQNNIKLIKGARTILKSLSRKYILSVATGMIKKTINKLIKKFAIEECFKLIITIDDIKREADKKPSPFMINEIRNKFKISANQTVYVGDSKSDVIMAQKANITPIVVLTGNLKKREAQRLGVKHILKNVTYLNNLLNK